MNSDRKETEQTSKSTETRDFREQLDVLEKCGFKKFKYNYKLLKRTGGNVQVVKAFLEAEQTQKEERKKRSSHDSSSSSSSSEEEKPWKKEKKDKKEYKNKSKFYKKIEKKEWKDRRNRTQSDQAINPAIIDLSGNAWPAEGSNLYLDGNNMLFVLGPIRKLALQGQRSHAESVLQGLAEEFAKKMGLTHCTLIYDNTNKSVSTASFVVCSARPRYATSDDALVAWAAQPEGKGLFVTSDRGLIERLHAVGSTVAKPKQWFAFVASVLSGGQVDDLESWVQTWMDKQQAQSEITNNNA